MTHSATNDCQIFATYFDLHGIEYEVTEQGLSIDFDFGLNIPAHGCLRCDDKHTVLIFQVCQFNDPELMTSLIEHLCPFLPPSIVCVDGTLIAETLIHVAKLKPRLRKPTHILRCLTYDVRRAVDLIGWAVRRPIPILIDQLDQPWGHA